MIRRAIVAVSVSVASVALPGVAAQALTYPPKPDVDVPQKKPVPKKEIKVKDPAKKDGDKAVLSRTGAQSTVPLTALGGGLLAVGGTLAAIGRRRRGAADAG